ncbi:MAG TPA: NADH-quinone oxidoreductase subunit C [Acidimicrobiia bacterium]|nr:NADH-quinone oxidoreductase subunit C [Acidimicrobiia bacterium]
MTSSQSDTETKQPEGQETGGAEPEPEAHPLQEFADRIAATVGGTANIQFDTVKVRVPAESWVEAHRVARDDLDLVFFSWLSAIDWSNEVEVGDPPDEEVEERLEVLSGLSDVTDGNIVIMSTDLPSDSPEIPSLVGVYAGAEWHEREAFEMFGITFQGHPNLIHLYLPDAFIGNPLRKSYPLLSREVKPWPGKVDVEAMPETDEEESSDEPSTENPEA